MIPIVLCEYNTYITHNAKLPIKWLHWREFYAVSSGATQGFVLLSITYAAGQPKWSYPLILYQYSIFKYQDMATQLF